MFENCDRDVRTIPILVKSFEEYILVKECIFKMTNLFIL